MNPSIVSLFNNLSISLVQKIIKSKSLLLEINDGKVVGYGRIEEIPTQTTNPSGDNK